MKNNLVPCSLLPILLVSTLSAPSVGLQTPRKAAAPAYELRPVWKSGDIALYKFSAHRITNIKISDQDILESNFRMTLRQTTQEVKPDGSVLVEQSAEKADGSFDGREMELTAAMPKMLLTRDKTGKPSVKAEGGVSLIRPIIARMFLFLAQMQRGFVPAVPVHVGETWKFSWQDTDEVEGKTEGTGTLVGPGTVDDQPTLQVKVEYTSVLKAPNPRGQGKIDVKFHFTGTADVDARTFQMARFEGRGEERLPGDETAKSEFSLTRLKRDTKTTGDTGNTGKKTE